MVDFGQLEPPAPGMAAPGMAVSIGSTSPRSRSLFIARNTARFGTQKRSNLALRSNAAQIGAAVLGIIGFAGSREFRNPQVIRIDATVIIS